MKFCTKCQEQKPLSDFARKTKSLDGRQNWCKLCMKKVNATLYKNGYKAIQYQHNKKNRAIYKDRFKELVPKASCVNCGESDPICLDFHHTDPTTKEFSVSGGIRHGYSMERLVKEAAKCIIICSNCHRKLHWGKA